MSTKSACVTRRRFSLRSLLFVLLLACAVGVYLKATHARAAAAATTFKVNSLADTDDGTCNGTNCTLREAINAANAGADTIDFSVTGTINLTGALPNITEDVTINGPGASLLTVRRNTGGDYRIFNVTTGGTVTLSGMTIRDGKASSIGGGGGGILNSGTGTLNVTNSMLIGNSAVGGGGLGGGIYNSNSGTVNVTNSTLSGNFTGPGAFGGGGIDNRSGTLNVSDSTLNNNSCTAPCGGGGIASGGTLTVTNTTIRNNSAGTGGGIVTANTATVTNTTISNNSAEVGGGGISNGGMLNVTNTTISNNLGGGLFNGGGGTVNVTNATVSGNVVGAGGLGGGIYNVPPGTLKIKSTIVALNMASTAASDLNGTITSQGYNVIGTTNGAAIVATTGDLFGVTAAQLKLDPLANNGGPTRTMALKSGSVAIDQGINSNSLAVDQRGHGFARTIDDPLVTNVTGGDGTDAGAFETKPGIPNICETHPWICQGLCEIPCPRCFAGCLYEIVFEDLVDPWKAIIFDPRGNPVRVQQMKRGNQVTMRFRVNERFADKVDEYTVVFRGGKPGTKPGARFQVKAIQ